MRYALQVLLMVAIIFGLVELAYRQAEALPSPAREPDITYYPDTECWVVAGTIDTPRRMVCPCSRFTPCD